MTLASLDYEGVQFEVQAPEDEVLNLGALLAEQGAAGVFAGTIKNAGRIEANSLAIDETGAIVLSAQVDIYLETGSSLSARGPSGGGIHVESETGTTWVTGEIDVRGLQEIGGTIQVLGNQGGVIGNAYLNASGESGGGEILIGGDYRGENPEIANAVNTFIGRDSTIAADALGNGSGGKVIVWADEVTRFLGSISARGGESSGDGGFVETSGKQHLEATGFVDASSVTGLAGTWLLDPRDTSLQIVPPTPVTDNSSGGAFSGGNPNVFTPTTDNAIADIDQIVVSLEGGTGVEVNTGADGVQAGDLTVVDAITVVLNTGNVSLTLSGANDLLLNNTITASGANTLTLNLISDSDSAGGGDTTIAADIETNGGLIDATVSGSGIINLSGSRTINSDIDFTTLNISSGTQTFGDGVDLTGTLNFSGGIISVGAGDTLTYAGTINWITGGTMLGGGTFANNTTVNFTGFGDRGVSGATTVFENQGSFNHQPGGAAGIDFRMDAGATFDNLAGGVFNFQDDVDIDDSNGIGSFINRGTVRKTGGGAVSEFLLPFNNNNGTLETTVGTIAMASGGTHTGTLSGIGIVRFTASTHLFNPGATLSGTIGLASGVLDVSNNPTLNGILDWTGGTIGNASGGTLTVGLGRTINLVGFGDRILSMANIDNQGTFNHNPGGGAGIDLFIDSGASFNNLANGVFNFQDDVDINDSGGGGTFVNAGTVRKTGGGGVSEFLLPFNNNNGVLETTVGTIGLASGGTHSGALTGVGDVRLNGGTHLMDPGATLAGTLGLDGAVLDVSNNPTLEGILNWTAGNIGNAGGGTLTIALGRTINFTGIGNRSLSMANIDNQGSFNHNPGGGAGIDLFIDSGASFNNLANGVFNLQDDVGINDSGGGGTFVNAGTVRKTAGSGLSEFLLPFDNNDGTLETLSGAIGLSSGGTHTGALAGVGDVRLTGGTHLMNGGSTLSGTLGLAGATLDVSNNPILDGTLNWTAGAIGNGSGGTFNVAPTGVINFTGIGDRFLSIADLDNQGVFNHAPGGGAGIDFFINTGATFNNLAGGVFNFQDDVDIDDFGVGSSFVNAGIVRKTGGGGSSDFFLSFNNNGGTVETFIGTIGLAAGGTHTGTFTGIGDVRMTGGTHTIAAGGDLAGTVGLGGAVLDVSNDPTLNGTLTWTAGNIGNGSGGTFTVGPGGIINFTGLGNRALSVADLDNQGTFNHGPGGGAGIDFFIDSGATFNNLATGVFNFQDDTDINDSGVGGTFVNAGGTVRKTGGLASSDFFLPFNNNDGTLESLTGNIGLTADGTHTGTLTGVGDVRLSAGTHTIAPGGDLAGIVGLAGAVLDVSNNPTLNGTLTWTAGNIGNASSGTLTVASGGVINFTGLGNRALSFADIDNQGTFNHGPGGGAGIDFFVDSGATFNNLAGGVFNFQDDTDIDDGAGGGTFENAGTVLKTGGGGTNSIFLPLNNSGVVDSGAGVIALAVGGTHTGTFTGVGGTTFSAGTQILSGGTLDGVVTLSGGAIDVSANPTLDGILNWTGGNIIGAGTLTVSPGATINFAVLGDRILNGATIDNQGTFIHVPTGGAGIDFFMDGNAVFNNLAGGVFDLQNDIDISPTGAGGTFNNTGGTILKSGGGGSTTFFTIPVTSSGIIDVQAGTLITSTLTDNDGTITLSNGGALTPSANLTSTGTISGDGTVNANVTSSGTIAPGGSPGITIINGDLILTGTSIVDIEVDGTAPGAGGHDQIQVTGTTTLDGTLNVILGFAPTNGDNFNIILCGTDCGGDFVTKNLPPNGFVTNDLGATYRLEFTGACAGDNCWTAAIDNLWSVAGNWSAGLPVGGQLVLVPDLAGTVTLDTDSTIGSLVLDDDLSITATNTLTVTGVADINAPVTILASGELALNGAASTIDTVTSNGILTNTGALTVETQMTLNAGFLLGVAGTTTIANGAALSVTGFTELQENTLFNDGVATLTGTLQLSNNGIYNNRVLGQTDWQGDVAIGGGGSTLVNAGLLRKTAGGGESISDSFLTNTGTIESASGTLRLQGPSDHSGGTLFSNGGDFILRDNNHIFDSSSTVTGNGTVTFGPGGTHTLDGTYTLVGTTNFTSSTINVDSNIDFDILNVTSATANFNSGINTVNQLGMSGAAPPLNLAGSLTVNTGFDWSTGSINDVGSTGSFITGAGSITNINVGPVSINSLDWTNEGTVNFNSGTITINSGIINNGTFNALGGSSLNGAGEFNNTGTFTKTVAGTFTVFSPDFNNTGTVDIDTGTFSHNSNVSTNSGAGVWDLSSTAVLAMSGDHTFNNTTPIIAAAGAVLDLDGVGSVVRFESLGTVLPANLTVDNRDTNMAGSGSLLVDGTLILDTASSISLNGGLATTGTTTVTGPTSVNATTWTNQGTVNWNGGAIQLIANGIINNDATFNSLNIAADTMFNSGVFNNNATYNKLGAGDPNISITFNNNGVVDVDVGSFTLTGDSNTSGSSDLAVGTTLFLSGTGATHNFNTANPITAVSADLSTSGIGPVVNFNTTGTVLPAGLTVTNAQTIGGSGSLQIDGTFNLENAGNVSVSGGLTTTGTSNINGNTSLSGTWNNQGTLDFNSGGMQINGGGILNNESTVNLLNTGTLMFGAGTYNNTAGATNNKPNAGNVTIFTAFNVADTSILDIADGDLTATGFATNSGTLTLALGTLLDPAAVFINLPTGLIQGSGFLQANVTNQGTIAPGTSPGIITITGDLLLDPTSVLDFELDGDTPGAGAGFHDQIVVTGNATLDGTINATLFGGFVPVAGNTFDIITCGGTCSGAIRH